MAKARARQRLVESGVSESELLEHECMDFICDAEVMDAYLYNYYFCNSSKYIMFLLSFLKYNPEDYSELLET